jgi:Eukaryotic translation initiation factor 3 subunit 8 N-terminus
VFTAFEDLTRAYQKALPVVAKEENGVTPRFYVRILAELEDFINEVWEDKDGRCKSSFQILIQSSFNQIFLGKTCPRVIPNLWHQ